MAEKVKAAKVLLAIKVEREIIEEFERLANDIEADKAWLIRNALRSYIERFDVLLADYRIASNIKENNVPLEEVLKEYGMEDSIQQRRA